MIGTTQQSKWKRFITVLLDSSYIQYNCLIIDVR